MAGTKSVWRPAGPLMASASAGIVLVCCSLVTPLPWPVWAAWGALTTGAIVQSIRR